MSIISTLDYFANFDSTNWFQANTYTQKRKKNKGFVPFSLIISDNRIIPDIFSLLQNENVSFLCQQTHL